jgi:hypothetical protein
VESLVRSRLLNSVRETCGYWHFLSWYNKAMQKIATTIFIYASIAFGIIGVTLALVSGPGKDDNSEPNALLMRLLMITVFIILPSFALSIAGKYLNSRQK